MNCFTNEVLLDIHEGTDNGSWNEGSNIDISEGSASGSLHEDNVIGPA